MSAQPPPGSRSGPSPAPGPDLSRWGRWVARCGALVVGVLAGVMVFSLVAQALTASAVRSVVNAMDLEVILPEAQDFGILANRSVVFSSDGVLLATLHDEVNRLEVELDDLPDHVWQAMLAAEDRKFFEHEGYDPEGIARAAFANLQAGEITQGGSTITQQLAKQTVGDDVTFDRKIEELFQAMALEQRFTKHELLDRYMNQVYFGYGAYGIGAASEEFYGIPPEELRVEQAALLASMVRAPGAFDPRTDPETMRIRRDSVLEGMVAMGNLDSASSEMVSELPLGVLPARVQQAREPYIVEAVKQEFFNNPAFGEDRAARIDAMFSGGLQIYTTIDPDLQRHAERVVREYLPQRNVGVTGAIASVDPRDGRVLAAAFGRDFDQEQFNLALQGRRQPGSAFKPFVLAEALEQGYPINLPLEGKNRTVMGEGLVPFDDPWVTEGVRNYGDASFSRLDLRDALIRSVNTAFAQLGLLVGPAEVIELTGRMGISERAFGGQTNPSIALGGLDVGASPLEMASAYGTFAFGGKHTTPHVIEKVVDHEGRVIYEADGDAQQVLQPAVNAAMVDIMQAVVSSGTGTAARIPGWDVAGKTGTTQENRDAWFVGYTPALSTAVWVGNPDERERLGDRATGGNTAAPMWRAFMERALEGIEPVGFPDVDVDLTPVQTGEPVEVPDVRDLTELEAFQQLVALKLVPEVVSVASGSPEGTILWQSPRGGSTASVGDEITLGVSTGVPPPPPPPPPPEPEPEPTTEEPEPDPEPTEEPPADPDPEPPTATEPPSEPGPTLPPPPEPTGPPDDGDGDQAEG
ncbi:MAG: transglycosylase domain-containing protein [Egibacteraceae bacterium]